MHDLSSLASAVTLVMPDSSEVTLVGEAAGPGLFRITEHSFEVAFAVGDVLTTSRREAEDWDYVTSVYRAAPVWLFELIFADETAAIESGLQILSGRGVFHGNRDLMRVTTIDAELLSELSKLPGVREVEVLRTPGDADTLDLDVITEQWF